MICTCFQQEDYEQLYLLLVWSWSSNTWATLCEELTHWKTLMLERLKAGGEGDDRGWDGWMASLTQWLDGITDSMVGWTWVWASSGRQWRTGKPGVLPSTESQRVRHDLGTEQQNNEQGGQCEGHSAREHTSHFRIDLLGGNPVPKRGELWMQQTSATGWLRPGVSLSSAAWTLPSQLLHVGDLCSLPAMKYMVALLAPKHKSSLNFALQWLSQPAFPSSPLNTFLSSLATPLILSSGKTRRAFAPVFLAS